MLRLLKIVGYLAVGVWSLVRTAEAGFAYWVRRATRPQELEALSLA